MSVSNPNNTDDSSSLGIIVKYMEKTVRLEEERKKDREELQSQISDVRKDMSEMVDNRLESFQGRFDALDAKLESMSKPAEPETPPEPGAPPGTDVGDILPGQDGSKLTSPPTQIHPPAVPKGIRGRRRYKREHGSQGQ